MKLTNFTSAVVAGSLALGLGGVALAEGANPAAQTTSGVAVSGPADDFAAFDDCLREQGVDVPELPDLPDLDAGELPDDLEMFKGGDFEVSDEAWEACESELPDESGFGFDDEAFAAFDQCMTGEGFDDKGPLGEGDAPADGSEPSEEDLEAFEDEIDAAFEKCEELLPEEALKVGCDDEHDGQADGPEAEASDDEDGDSEDGDSEDSDSEDSGEDLDSEDDGSNDENDA